MSRVNVLCNGLKEDEKAKLEKIFSKTIDIYAEAKGIHNTSVCSEEWKQELREDGICEEDITMIIDRINEIRSNKTKVVD